MKNRAAAKRMVLVAVMAAGLAGCRLPLEKEGLARAFEHQVTVEALESIMTGSYSSAAQAAADPDYADIRLEMRRIWPGRIDLRGPDERAMIWVYVEQAAASALERPYRQRLYRVVAKSAGDEAWIESEVYTLPGEALAYAGAWRDPARFDGLSPRQLAFKEGCTVTLRSGRGASPEADELTGGTTGTGCASDLRGAVYATSEVTITGDELRTWDRGFDAAGNQVWGATKGPYIFRRVEASR